MSSSDPNEVPACLKRLVRTTVRTFYSREHALIIDLLVRNTIMKEDDLCERLRFEKKQLRQNLHTLKTEQFIKSKIQLETDAENKIAKIIHYFIDYKVFVNVVKYRLDLIQRKLEAEQRQNTCRALFRCQSCNSTYTDLEVDRILDFSSGNLICVYCRNEVKEEEDNGQRTDIRASVAKFHQTIRGPLDALLKECDQVHLSSSILEPEFRALEPLPGSSTGDSATANSRAANSWLNDPSKSSGTQSTEVKVNIVMNDLQGSSNAPAPKEKPIWMSVSTVDEGGIGELKSGGQTTSSNTTTSTFPVQPPEPATQTLAPGRVPTNLVDNSRGGQDGGQSSANSNSHNSAMSSDIMQLLRVHERRGLESHGPKTALSMFYFRNQNFRPATL
ncbi:unnamed protein product [Rodentolepis nana]|uniref:HTH TFE/IIEalpha-type domain-containing protein n=1 Tax=Rodentolepis nana TaxID=102285 RepID=A0A0R3TBX2_RODNA|nr:unnamed protein product [Rodentolepis nana]